MNLSIFRQQLPEETRGKLSDATIVRWFKVYQHVIATGQADRFDAVLSKKVDYPSEAAIARLLKQMSDAGLLRANRVVVKYTEIGRAFLGIGMRRTDGPPPGVFYRYTLPGLIPALPLLSREKLRA